MGKILKDTTVVFLALFFLFFAGASTALSKKKGPSHVNNSLKTSSQVSKGAVEKEKKEAEANKKQFDETAIKVVAETYKVVKLLDDNKDKEALDLLKKVIGELEVVLASNKSMSLVPINSYSIIADTDLEPEQIIKHLDKVKMLLEKGQIQEARVLLNGLRSEINIIIENLPLATYPDAMKLAAKYIANNKLSEARSVLTVALNSMVIETVVIPLPLVRAKGLVKEASKTANINKEKALEYLDEAKKQLRIAQILGYGHEDAKEYKELKERINSIQKEIKGKNKAEKMFEELLKKLKEFKEKLTSKS